MRNQNYVIAAVTCALAACAAAPQRSMHIPFDPKSDVYQQGYDPATIPLPLPCLVTVQILEDESDQIIVGPEPATTRFCGVSTTKMLFWRLPIRGPYTFPAKDAIVFKGSPTPTGVVCSLLGSNRVVGCSFGAVPGQTYKYALTVLKNGVALPILDPTVFNN